MRGPTSSTTTTRMRSRGSPEATSAPSSGTTPSSTTRCCSCSIATRSAATRLKAGEDLATLAAEAGVEVVADVSATRRGSALEPELANAIFSVRAPEGEGRTIGGATLSNGDYGVFVIQSAELGAEVDDSIARQVAQGIGSSEFNAYVEDLMANAEVSIRPDALQ